MRPATIAAFLAVIVFNSAIPLWLPVHSWPSLIAYIAWCIASGGAVGRWRGRIERGDFL
jgi:hypothetical protein